MYPRSVFGWFFRALILLLWLLRVSPRPTKGLMALHHHLDFHHHQAGFFFFGLKSMVVEMVPLTGGIGGIVHPPIGRKNTTYIWDILPFGGLYATYHLLGEPEATIDKTSPLNGWKWRFNTTCMTPLEAENEGSPPVFLVMWYKIGGTCQDSGTPVSLEVQELDWSKECGFGGWFLRKNLRDVFIHPHGFTSSGFLGIFQRDRLDEVHIWPMVWMFGLFLPVFL